MRRVEKRIFDNIVRCLPIILSAFLTACNPGASNSSGVSDGEAPGGVLSGDMLPADTAPYADSTSAPAPAAGKPEWVYVPERIEIRDERADYDAMRLIGDTVCYISMNGGRRGRSPGNLPVCAERQESDGHSHRLAGRRTGAGDQLLRL